MCMLLGDGGEQFSLFALCWLLVIAWADVDKSPFPKSSG